MNSCQITKQGIFSTIDYSFANISITLEGEPLSMKQRRILTSEHSEEQSVTTRSGTLRVDKLRKSMASPLIYIHQPAIKYFGSFKGTFCYHCSLSTIM